MTTEPVFFYIVVVVFFGTNSFNELDRRTASGPINYALATLASLFWPLSLLSSILSLIAPSSRNS
ncbi:MAG: hypothetical protein L3J67_09360 [Hyphomicrobiaceae bacterium]|nr:hypothetical protein [Hyphomicrobiaceae bacterium]